MGSRCIPVNSGHGLQEQSAGVDRHVEGKTKIEWVLAWVLLMVTFAGAVVEPVIIRTIVENLLNENDTQLATYLLIAFVGVVLPVFSFTGVYALRQIRKLRQQNTGSPAERK